MAAVPALFGPYGSVELPARVRDHGVNAAWFHGFDEAAFDACERLGLLACVEYATFRADLERRPELAPIGVDGRPIRRGRKLQGVCLSQRAFLDELEDGLVQGLASSRPAGVWLDYLTYAGWFETPAPDLQESCFCPSCIADFCEAAGVDAYTPAEILARHAAAWEERKCARVAGVAGRYAQRVREAHPHCVVGAYMCPWRPDEWDGALTRIFAQDYAALHAAIDVFTPLIYCQKSGRSAAWAREWMAAAAGFVPPDRRIQPILDALDYPASVEELAGARPAPWGLQLFDGARVLADPEQADAFARAVARISEQQPAAAP